jgi:hypothetical protein
LQTFYDGVGFPFSDDFFENFYVQTSGLADELDENILPADFS